MPRKPIPLEVHPDAIDRRFSESEAGALADAWLEAYGRDREGIYVHQFMWHVFSYKRTPSAEGPQALAAYQSAVAETLIVLANDRRQAVSTRVRPDSSSLQDWYVFPPNLAWTMVFTHETNWCGPYFARHPDFEHLNKANEHAVRKAQEAAEARRRGWS